MKNLFKHKVKSLLLKSQKYTKADNIYLARGGFWLGLSQGLTMAIAVVLSIIWARFVPKEVYGQYKFVLSFIDLFAIFTLTGMESSLITATAKGFEGTAKKMLKIRFKFSSLAVLAGFGLAFYYWFGQNNVLAICFLLAGIFSPFIESLNILPKYLEGKKRFDLEAKIAVAKTFIAGIFTVLAIFLTNNVIWLVFTYFTSRFALSIIFAFLILKFSPPKNDKIDTQSIKFGKHLSLVGVLGRLASQLDKILIFHYLGSVQLAVYAFATLIPDSLDSFSKNLQQLIFPKFATKTTTEIKTNLKQKTLQLFLVLLTIVLLYILLAPLVFKLFFPKYTEAIFLTQIYSLALLSGISIIPRTSFLVKNKTKIIYIKNTLLSCNKIILMFLGLYFFGVIGLVCALVLERFVQTVTNFALLKHL